MRWRRLTWCAAGFGVAAIVCILFVLPGAASAFRTVVHPMPEPPPPGFQVRASHGYTISVIAYSGGFEGGAKVYLTARRGNAVATYTIAAAVTSDGIRADLGSLGRVDLSLVKSGRKETVRPRCTREPEEFEPASYVGTFEFDGEGGYTQVALTTVPVRPYFGLLAGRCPGSGSGEALGPGIPGARIRGVSFAGDRSLFFQVNKNRPRTPTVFTASLRELEHGILVFREIRGVAPASAFRFDHHLRRATLSPPAPFHGSATLLRRRDSLLPSWTGDLSLDFPGHAEVPLAGRSVHVNIRHARFTRSDSAEGHIGI